MSRFPKYLEDALFEVDVAITAAGRDDLVQDSVLLRKAIERYKDVAVIKAVEELKAKVKAALEGTT